jgi:hypothetical protein
VHVGSNSATAPPSRTERAAAVLRRILDVASGILRGLSLLAITAAVAVIGAWLAWILQDTPSAGSTWLGRCIMLAIALVPTGVLLLFVSGIRQLRELPERVRDLPADLRVQAADLRATSRRREPKGILGLLRSLFRLGRIVFGSRDLLSPYAAIAAALRPAILVAALFAALAAVVEIPVALITLVVLML